MHLLATTSGTVDGAAAAVDLKQSPGDIVFLSAADSELAALAQASDQLPAFFPTIRMANLMQLQHNYSVDLYTEKTLANAKLVVVRLLGGKSYWSYGVDSLCQWAEDKGAKLVFVPGSNATDAALISNANVPAQTCESMHRYLAHGGPENARAFWYFCKALLDGSPPPTPAAAFEHTGIYKTWQNVHTAKVGIVFYRSLLEGGLTAPIVALGDALAAKNIDVSALYVASLKDKNSAAMIAENWGKFNPDVIINATSFAVGNTDNDPLSKFDCPVLQITLAGNTHQDWKQSTRGLATKDLAMSVVLPELDGRIFTRPISFKADAAFHERTQCRIVGYQPIADRIAFVAEQAAGWAALRHCPNSEKRIAIVLANYPNKDGRLANGVGYDTPASTINILRSLKRDGYGVANIPTEGNALMQLLQVGITNANGDKTSDVRFPLADYAKHFAELPKTTRSEIETRWGKPENDPFVRGKDFHLAVLQFGNVTVGIQPARGYNIDPKQTYHDAALVPPHGYLAFYFWLRHKFNANAIIHNGKHGNLEWLPGKSAGLSATCYPEAALGPLPHIYPFIVNDPGEGSAAKRRASAVIIDHLTPPLSRAETYGPLKDLEALVDEYYLASGLDARRLTLLKTQILDLTRHHMLDQDAGFTGEVDADLQKLDSFLCDLKEAQIRDGLHILGQSPEGQQEADLLVALTRVPRGEGDDSEQSLIRAIAKDFALGFDPLNNSFVEPWNGPRPEALQLISNDPWRTHGDTVERLELLASRLLESSAEEHVGDAAKTVLNYIAQTLRPTLRSSGPNEISNLLRALNGKPVPPGPSGAPTRGRLDVLPTGRNFYSLDNRTLPTPTAWILGKASADALLMRHFQDTGQHLKTVGLSVWGTANMRTGGDDLAQALWLLGAKPVWDLSSWRVTGFEIQPLAVVGRPRVDVTLRISGLFRDAFPTQIELLDKAIRAVATLDEPDDENPLAMRTRSETQLLQHSGLSEAQAASLAADRIFGAKPGAYGAGLQTLIDEKLWDTRADLAAAYVTWGAYVYGAEVEGRNAEQSFKRRLAAIEAVIHNQDNREHDLLDSDDYYQFEGGMNAAVETASGKKPKAYHNDHSRPERPVIRTLEEEVARVMRSRVINPKWINGLKRHGYKGAFEIAATVDYMFAFAATTDAVKSHHFDLAYDAFIQDDTNLAFMADNNPAALREMAERFAEAVSRGLWQPRLNSVFLRLKELSS